LKSAQSLPNQWEVVNRVPRSCAPIGLASAQAGGLLSAPQPKHESVFDKGRQPQNKGLTMKTSVLFGMITTLAMSLLAADSSPKDEVKARPRKTASRT
jgi:hypothetical protein